MKKLLHPYAGIVVSVVIRIFDIIRYFSISTTKGGSFLVKKDFNKIT